MKTNTALIAILTLSLSLHSAEHTWTGSGSDNNWPTAANWNNNITPTTDGSATLIFAGSTRTTANNTFTPDTPFNGIRFTNNGSNDRNSQFTLSGNRIKLGGSITTTSSSSALTDTISLPLLLSDTLEITLNNNHSLTINGVISELSNPSGLTKTGAGNMTLNGANTYTGPTQLTGGQLWFNTIKNIGEGASSFGAPLNSTDATIKLNSRLIFTGSSATTDRPFNAGSSGVLEIRSATTRLTMNGPISLQDSSLAFRGHGSARVNGKITGNSGVTHTDRGTLTLTNDSNDFTGKLQISDGTIEVTDFANSGLPSATGAGNQIQLGQPGWDTVGRLKYIGNSNTSSDREVIVETTEGAVDKGGIIENATADTLLTLSGDIKPGPSSSARQPVLQLSGRGDGELSGTVSGSLSLERTEGNGTWTLSGNNTYNGYTLIASGTLRVDGTTHADSSITVTSAGALSGNGTINGKVTVTPGGTINLGSSPSDTLSLSNTSTTLTMNEGNLVFALGTNSGECSAIDIAGTLTLDGSTTISLEMDEYGASPGTYTLMTFNNLAGSGSVNLAHNYPNLSLTTDADTIYITITGSGSANYLTWQGDGTANIWDTTTPNWITGAYGENSNVLFTDTGSDQPAINISPDPVAPYQVTIDTSTRSYTLSGAGITGPASLVKLGSSGAVLAGNHTYTGNTLVKAGSLTLNGSLDGSSLEVASGAAFNATADSSISGSNVGILCLSTSTLAGNNSYDGETIIGAPGYSNVTLNVAHNNALGSTAVGTVVVGGTELNFNNSLVLKSGVTVNDEHLTLRSATGRAALAYTDGSGEATWGGDITLEGSSNFLQVNYNGGTITIGTSSDNTIFSDAPTSLSFRGWGTVIVNSTIQINTSNIWRDDAGTLILNSGNHVFGSLSITQGTFKPGATNAFPSDARLIIGKGHSAADAIVNLNGFDQVIGQLDESHAATGNGIQLITSAEPATLTVDNSMNSNFVKPGSTIEGKITLKKLGTANLTLGNINTYSGATIVSNGILTVNSNGTLGSNSSELYVGGSGKLALYNSNALNPATTITLPPKGVDSAKIYLDDGVEVVADWLLYGTNYKDSGTYGASGSGADHIDDTRFEGRGLLRIIRSRNGLRILLK